VYGCDSMGQPGDIGDSMIVTSCAAAHQRARRDTITVPSAHKTTLKDLEGRVTHKQTGKVQRWTQPGN